MPRRGTPVRGGHRPGGLAGGYTPAVLDVLTLQGDRIAAVTGFITADVLGLPAGGRQVTGAQVFARFGLPAVINAG